MKGRYGNPSRYTKELTEDTFYDTVKELDIDSLKVLNVNLLEYDSGWAEPTGGYIAVPASDLARMCGIKFINGEGEETVVMFYQTGEPVIEIDDGTCTIIGEDGSTIYYTTDGSDPKSSSTKLHQVYSFYDIFGHFRFCHFTPLWPCGGLLTYMPI